MPSASDDLLQPVGNRALTGLLAKGDRDAGAPRPTLPRAGPGQVAVMRARMPAEAELQSLVGAGTNQPHLVAGLRRLIDDAMAELRSQPGGQEQVEAVRQGARGNLTHAAFQRLPEHDRLSRLARAIRQLHPDRALGDPAQYTSRLRTGRQRANLATLLANTDRLFADILSAPALTSWISEIFGAAQHSRVLRRLRRARRGLRAAGRRRSIRADMSGYSSEVDQLGLAGFQTHIDFVGTAIEQPTTLGSIALGLHEALHFGTGAVIDHVYLTNSPAFTTLSTDKKVNNAAHYEVLAYRVRDPGATEAFPAPNNVFTPQTSTGPGATLSPEEHGRRTAEERYSDAWSNSIWVWERCRDAWRRPSEWDRLRRFLPYWSAVTRLTLHERTIRTRGRPDERPVTLLDLALAESFTRKLNVSYGILSDADPVALEAQHATAAERSAATTAAAHTELLVKCALRASGLDLTGSVDRDAAVVRLLSMSFDDLYRPRDPATAPPL